MIQEMKSAVLLFCALMLTACLSLESPPSDTRVFTAPRTAVWEALIRVFNPYRLEVSDEEKGLIRTEWIQGAKLFTPAHDKYQDISGVSAQISAQLIYEKPEATVIIRKEVKKKAGFLSAAQSAPSDLLEERILLYRLKRELHIGKLIKEYGN